MMDRRGFLKLSGLLAAATALEALPAAAAPYSPVAAVAEPIRDLASAISTPATRLAVHEAGTYRVSGLVRLLEPLVEIAGITNSQWISWSEVGGSERPVASFTTFEHFDGPGMTPEIRVRGGKLESLSVIPMDFDE